MRKHLIQILALCLLAPTPALAAFAPSDNLEVLRYTASSNQQAFSVTWGFLEANDVIVETSVDAGVTWVAKTLTTDYALTGAGGSSGTLSFVSGHCDDATTYCNSGTLVVIYRYSAPKEISDFSSSISSAALNQKLDQLASWVQELQQKLNDQALKVPVTDDIDATLGSLLGHGGESVIINDDEDGFDYTLNTGGSVTSVAVSGANGIGVSGSPITVSGTVALSLGAITPTSVTSSGGVLGTSLQAINAATAVGKLRLYDLAGTHYAELTGPSSGSTSYSLALPPADCSTPSCFLMTDGAGTASWSQALPNFQLTNGGFVEWKELSTNGINSFTIQSLPSQTANHILFTPIVGTFTYDPASLADGAGETKTFTCTGAVVGDLVQFTPGNDPQGMIAWGYVQSADSCRVRLQNESGGTIDLASSTWKFMVWSFA